MKQENPISVSPDKRVALPLFMIVGMIGATVSATFGWSALQSDVKAATGMANRAHIVSAQQEERLRALERAQIEIAEMRRDVEWIKRRMEEEARRQARD